MSNGTDQAQPPAEKTGLLVESRPKKRASPGDNWAPPPGWTTEEKVRTSGTKAGLVDKVKISQSLNRKVKLENFVFGFQIIINNLALHCLVKG